MNIQFLSKNSSKLIILLISGILLFGGCAKHNRKVITNFNNRPCDFEQEIEHVKLEAKYLNKKEAKTIFNSPSRYKFFKLQITNNSENAYIINQQSINLKTIPPKKIYKRGRGSLLKTILLIPLLPILGIIAGIGVVFSKVALAATPGKIAGVAFFQGLAELLAPIVLGFSVGVILTPISGTIWGLRIHKNNKKLKNKLNNSVLDNQMSIPPHSTLNTMIVLDKKEINKDLEIKLFNQEKKKYLKFTIPLPNLNSTIFHDIYS